MRGSVQVLNALLFYAHSRTCAVDPNLSINLSSMQRLIEEKKYKRIYSFDWLELLGTLNSILNVCIFMHKIRKKTHTEFFLLKMQILLFENACECTSCVFECTSFVNEVLAIIILTTKRIW